MMKGQKFMAQKMARKAAPYVQAQPYGEISVGSSREASPLRDKDLYLEEVVIRVCSFLSILIK
jgi:hypothetical protein